MFCEKCGSEMLDTAKFCPSCGAKADPVDIEEQVTATDTVEEKEPLVEDIAETNEPEPAEEPAAKAEVEEKPEKKETPPPPPPKYTGGKDLTKPISTASYFFMFFLMALPLIRLIMLLVWSFSDNVNVNKKHFAHAVFIWVLVSLILAIVATVVLFILYGSAFYEIFMIWQ